MDAETRIARTEIRILVNRARSADVYSDTAPETKARKCGKCGGTGYIASYSHIAGGRCMPCDGTGKVSFITAAGRKQAAAALASGKVAHLAHICAIAAQIKDLAVRHPELQDRTDAALADLRVMYKRLA